MYPVGFDRVFTLVDIQSQVNSRPSISSQHAARNFVLLSVYIIIVERLQHYCQTSMCPRQCCEWVYPTPLHELEKALVHLITGPTTSTTSSTVSFQRLLQLFFFTTISLLSYSYECSQLFSASSVYQRLSICATLLHVNLPYHIQVNRRIYLRKNLLL